MKEGGMKWILKDQKVLGEKERSSGQVGPLCFFCLFP